MNSASLVVVNEQNDKYKPLTKGYTNPIKKAIVIGNKNTGKKRAIGRVIIVEFVLLL